MSRPGIEAQSHRPLTNILTIILLGQSVQYDRVEKVNLHLRSLNIYIYIVLFGPVKPEFGVIPSGKEDLKKSCYIFLRIFGLH